MPRARVGLLLLVALMIPAIGATAWTNDIDQVTVTEAGGLSPETIAAATEAAALVGARMAVIHTGNLRLMGVTRHGVDIQRPAPGLGFPMAVAAIDPETSEPLLGARLAGVLDSGRAVMSELSAALRGASAGDVVELEGWNGDVIAFEIGAIVPDADIEWSEILLSATSASTLGFERPARVALWDVADLGVARLLLTYLVPDGPIRVRTAGDHIDPRDRVLPTVVVKQRFGEFAYRATGIGDEIEMDPAWVEANIVDVDIPPLGLFRCHRSLVPYLRGVITEIQRHRLEWLLDARDFQNAGGCYNPRLMRGGDKGSALSRHAWGIAIDINPSSNPYGGPVRLEPRIGEAFRRWGFAWGAGWPFPDGMHFEWTRVPEDLHLLTCADRVLERSSRSGISWEVYPRPGRCAVS